MAQNRATIAFLAALLGLALQDAGERWKGTVEPLSCYNVATECQSPTVPLAGIAVHMAQLRTRWMSHEQYSTSRTNAIATKITVIVPLVAIVVP